MSSSQILSNHTMPTPPAFPRRVSTRNTRLTLPSRPEDPPIPPRLVGSPLLDKLISTPNTSSQQRISGGLWIDGDEFGISTHSPSQSPVVDSAMQQKSKRSVRQSPPPEPRYTTNPPPPLPPFSSVSHARHAAHKSSLASDLLSSSHSPRQIVT